MIEAERLAAELTAAFPSAECGGSDAALRMGAVAVDASVCMEAAAELRRLRAVVAWYAAPATWGSPDGGASYAERDGGAQSAGGACRMSDREETTDENRAMWGEQDGSVIGYMCKVDWECELGAASGGNRVHPSIEDIKERRPCVAGCGIVEVEVRFRRVVEPGTHE